MTILRDGGVVIITDEQETQSFYDLDGQPIADAPADVRLSGRYSPSGQLIFIVSEQRVAQLLDQAGSEVASFEASVDMETPVQFSSDEQTILTFNGISASTDQPRLWNRDGDLLATFVGDEAEMSPDGERILVWDRVGSETRLYDRKGSQITVFKGVYGRFMPDGRSVLTWSQTGPVKIWREAAALSADILRVQGRAIQDVVFSPDGQRFMTILRDGGVILWDRQRNQVATFDGITAIFSSDNQYILVESAADTQVEVRDMNGALQRSWSGKQISFSADGQRFLVMPPSDAPELWSAAGQQLATLAGDFSEVGSLQLSPSGLRIFATIKGETTWVFDDSGTQQAVLRGTQPMISPDDQLIVTHMSEASGGNWNDSVLVWDLRGTLLATLPGQQAAFSPDGKTVATGGEEGKLQLYDVSSQQPIDLQAHYNAERIDTVYFSPQGLHVISTGLEYTLVGLGRSEAILWDRSGQKIAIFPGALDAIFSPDGKFVLVWYVDSNVGIYDLYGSPITTLRDVYIEDELKSALTFDARGNRLFAATADGAVQQHLLNANDLLVVAACRIGRELTADEIARYGLAAPTFSLATRQCPPVFSWER
jgi:WD40 repeat protein